MSFVRPATRGALTTQGLPGCVISSASGLARRSGLVRGLEKLLAASSCSTVQLSALF